MVITTLKTVLNEKAGLSFLPGDPIILTKIKSGSMYEI